MANVLLALGGNVGDARATVAGALRELDDGTTMRLLKRSSDYVTPPWGVEDQPPFVNAVAEVETTLTPDQVLARVQEVERVFGRDRSREHRWGPRTLDIDILAYDDLAVDIPGLTLPHPRMFQRGFVLVPLAEILPGRVINGHRVKDALTNVDTAGIERLPTKRDD